MTKVQEQSVAYQASNLACAKIVAADPDRYPGLMQEWAQLVLQRANVTPINTEVNDAD